MKRDSRLSITLHVLLHMAESPRPLTSEEIAQGMSANAAALRRTLAGLREAGFVRAEKGHGGGWTLGRPLAEITLGDVYDALGAPTVFAMGDRTESPGCLVEQAVNRAMQDAFGEAQSLLLTRLHAVTLAEVAGDVQGRHAKKQHAKHTTDHAKRGAKAAAQKGAD